MFQKTKLKKSYISAIGMSLVLLLVNTLGVLLGTGVGQITPPSTDVWSNYTLAPTGSGTSESPYKVTKAEELAWFLNNGSSSYVTVENDIDLGAHSWAGIPYGKVSNFDGKNHTISNLNGSQGVFNMCTANVKNLILSNVNIKSNTMAGAVAMNTSGSVTFQNITVKSGIVQGSGYVGGICGQYGKFTNCVNNATVKSAGNYVGGIVGYNNSTLITNCINTGKVIGADYVGGIAGYGEWATNCLAECTIIGSTKVGGLIGELRGGVGTVTDCGFNGEIFVEGSSAVEVGSMVGSATSVIMYFANNFGVADIHLNKSTDMTNVCKHGAFAGNLPNVDLDAESSYSYSRIFTSKETKEYRKYKTKTSEKTPFSKFAYHKNINGGFPFPKTLFAVGQFIDSDVMGYLEEYGFSTPPVIKNDGTHYYVELGEYPQTYVGDSLNSTLKSWYTINNPSSVDSYTNDLGTSADTITHYVYSYNGNKYVRVISSVIQGSYKTQDESTTLMPNQEYWFKVEPIKWWVLNYTEVQNGANPIVLAEQALTANVTWNKTEADGNLWASKSNIRTWLNSTFYNDAFKVGYADYIQTTIVKNNSSSSNTDGSGTTTNDNVWLLSYGEAGGGTAGQYSEKQYFNSNTERLCSPTDYALVNNCYMYVNASYPTEIRKNGGSCVWWHRSANTSITVFAQSVYGDGSLGPTSVTTSNYAVRPALTLVV